MFDHPPAYMCSASFISSGIELLNMFERLLHSTCSIKVVPSFPVHEDLYIKIKEHIDIIACKVRLLRLLRATGCIWLHLVASGGCSYVRLFSVALRAVSYCGISMHFRSLKGQKCKSIKTQYGVGRCQ